jgi:hypothetical protein
VIEDEEVVMLLNDPETPEDIRGVIEFAWYTGWRALDEVTYLTWGQVNLPKGEIRWSVGTTKNSKGRLLAFDPEAELGTLDAAIRDLLLVWRERATVHKGKRYVFHRNGRRVAKKRWYQSWHAACDRHEIKDVRSPNGLYRTCFPGDDQTLRGDGRRAPAGLSEEGPRTLPLDRVAAPAANA